MKEEEVSEMLLSDIGRWFEYETARGWIFRFGKKHYGRSVSEVLQEDPGYIAWMVIKADFGSDVNEMLMDLADEAGVDLEEVYNKRGRR
jgi:hypothetical protein